MPQPSEDSPGRRETYMLVFSRAHDQEAEETEEGSSDNGRNHNKSSIKICSWNINGLTLEKAQILNVFFSGYDIICLQETWNTHDRIIDLEGFNGFHFIRKKLNTRANRGSGGISLFVKDNSKYSISVLKSHDDFIVWFKINGVQNDVAVCSVYFPPDGSSCNYERDDYFDLLQNDILHYQPNFDIVILGDVNARTGELHDYNVHLDGDDDDFIDPNIRIPIESFPDYMNCSRMSLDRENVNTYGRKLIDLCKSVDVRIVNGRVGLIPGLYTRMGTTGNSVVDYCLMDHRSACNLHGFKIEKQLPESDHLPLSISMLYSQDETVDMGPQRLKGRKILNYKWKPDELYLLSDQLANCQDLKETVYKAMCNNDDVNDVAEAWSNYFEGAVETVFDSKTCNVKKINFAPWIDQECKDVRRDLLADDSLLQREKLKNYKRLLQSKKRKYKQDLLDSLDKNCGNNPVTFWKLINGLPSAQRNSNVKLSTEEVVDKISVLSQVPQQDYFDKIFESHVEHFINTYESVHKRKMEDKDLCKILNCNVDVEEVEFAVKKLKKKKSPGIDRIPVEFIKESIEIIKYDLTELFNYVLSQQKYPDRWGHGLRIAIPKGPQDIRPITIEPIFAKIFETVLDNRISFLNEAFQKTDRYNGGFLKGSMTQDNLLILTAIIEKQLCLGKPLYLAFVDFKKAFNYVNHNMLFYKLLRCGMSGRFVNTLRDMYGKIGAFIKVNNRIYDWVTDTCGTNQGGPLSPNMFRFILSDLRNYLYDEYGVILQDEIIVHLLWADDLVLLADSPEGLQKQLNGLHMFCSKYQLIVNESKTKIMVYGKYDNDVSFTFNDKDLQIVQEYKYLGVLLNPVKSLKGNIFKEMWPFIAEKATKASFSVTKKCASAGHLTPKIALQLFDSFVTPILNYGSELWCKNNEIPCIERVQLKFIKYILGVKSSTCTVATLGETGRFPIVLSQHIKLLKYWVRILQLDNSKLVKKAMLTLRSLTSAGFSTWLSKVEDLLSKNNFHDFINISCISEKDGSNLLKDFKERTFNEFITKWKDDVRKYPILRCFRTFKKEFELEKYLKCVRDPKLRKCISKLRLSSHKLSIETGRYTKPKTPEEQRICQYCNLNTIENECHFVLQCPYYTEERVKLLTAVLLREPDTIVSDDCNQTLINILSTDNESIVFSLGKFLDKCFSKRVIVQL